MNEINNSQVQGLNIGNNINSSLSSLTQGDFKNQSFVKIFKEEDKNTLISEIEKLNVELRKVKNEIQSFRDISEDDKEEIEAEILNNIKQIKNVKNEVAQLPIGQETPADKIKMIEGYLDNSTSIVGKIEEMGDKASGLSEKLAPYVTSIINISSYLIKFFN
ncbi:MAG: hypothetical protein AABZ74_18350 [Cyanobacteriota bacterium]